MAEAKKIAMISANFPPAICGVGDYTSNLVKSLRDQGLNISVFSGIKGGLKETLNLLKQIKKFDPQVVHLQYEPFSFNQSYSLPLLLPRLSHPTVLTLHEVWHRNFLQKKRDIYLYKRCHKIIVNDQGCLERVKNLVPELSGKMVKIGVGPNVPTLSSLPEIREAGDEVIISYFGFFNEARKISILIEAFAQLQNRYDQKLKLHLIGPKEGQTYNKLLQQIEKLQISGSVVWTGALPAAGVSMCLVKSRVAVLPFVDGASPRRGSFQACLALGVPVVTTTGLYTETDIKHLKNCYLVKELTTRALAGAISKLIDDTNLANMLRVGGLNYSKEYSWERIAQKNMGIYAEVACDT